MTKFLRWLLPAIFLFALPAAAATLLPPGKQTFLDGNGNPLVGGTVSFYVPGTTTLKDTYQDAGGTVLNANPLTLDGSGTAVIYGTGAYRQVVKDSLGNTIWDQITADTAASSTSWGGTSGGTANAQTVTAPNFTSADGQIIGFRAGFTPTGALTLNPSGLGAINVLKDTSAGSVSFTGGEFTAGAVVQVVYDSTVGAFHWVGTPPQSAYYGAQTSIASATTTDFGTITTHNALVTGTVTITSFGSSASTAASVYKITFAGALTLTHNATSLILPGGANITTAAGDTAEAIYLGSGNWRVTVFTTAASRPLLQAGGTLTGALAMSGNKVTGLGTPTTGTDAATKTYADSIVFARGSTNGSGSLTAAVNMTSASASSGGLITWTLTNPATSSTSLVCVATASAGSETAAMLNSKSTTIITTYTTQVSGAGVVVPVDLVCFGS